MRSCTVTSWTGWCRRTALEAARTARGPSRAPTRYPALVSKGTPTYATSSCRGSVTWGMRMKVAILPCRGYTMLSTGLGKFMRRAPLDAEMWASAPNSAPEQTPLRIVQRLGGHRRRIARAEIFDLDGCAGRRAGQRQVAVRDAAADRVAVVRARHVSQNALAVENGFLAEHHPPRVVERHVTERAG